jgi:glycosyltransferase involved in cell wall biosynthesis
MEGKSDYPRWINFFMIKKITKLKKSILSTTNGVGSRVKQLKKTVVKSARPKKNLLTKKTPKQEKQRKVLMFGWELPPYNSGGLGVACYELAEAMSNHNSKITFVLPSKYDMDVPFMDVTHADSTNISIQSKDSVIDSNIKIQTVRSNLSPYLNETSYIEQHKQTKRHIGCSAGNCQYGDTLIDEVYRYGESAAEVAKKEDFEIIHAHDWLSFPAGIKAKEVSHKPLVVHVHALEYDRSYEGGVNAQICAIEKSGMEAADKVIAVSGYTKKRIVDYYGIPADKIEVVHNGINIANKPIKKLTLKSIKSGGKKMVLFVGRITYQKGVDYLIEAAAKALKINKKLVFMIVGSGDMSHQIINQAANHAISDKVFFPGFLRGEELSKIYASADLYVMPSVSEPFGLVALEALSHKVPVIVSKQSGASEVIMHSLKVDFWDTNELANKIVAVIENPSLADSLSKNGHKEALSCTWDCAAKKCMAVYNQLVPISS